MNHDENTPDMHTWIEPELEARVVAWVAGEASAFEIAELERLLLEKPELALFKRRMEAVQGLVTVAVRPDATPLRLSPERRAKLLSVIGHAARNPEGSGNSDGYPPVKNRGVLAVFTNKARPAWQRVLTIAAGLMLGLSVPALFRIYTATQPKMLQEVALGEHEAIAPPSLMEPRDPQFSDVETVKRDVDARKRLVEDKARGGGPQNYSFNKVASYDNMAAASSGAPSDEIVKMEPFEVNAPAERGYAASATLGGTRVASNMKDIGSGLNLPKPVIASDAFGGVADGSLRSEIEKMTGRDVSLAAKSEAPAAAAKRAKELRWGASSGTKPPAAPRVVSADRKARQTRELDSARPAPQQTSIPTSSPAKEALALSEKNEVFTPYDIKGSENKQITQRRAAVTGAEPGAATPTGSLAEPPVLLQDKPAARLLKRPAPEPVLTEELNASREAVSTFSLHVSDVSFRLAQAALERGQMPDTASLRAEEFYNAINYGDPAPAMAEKVSCRVEQAAHPFAQQRNLLRIAMQVASSGRGVGTPLRLTVLLDTSGSMEREDRAHAVRRAFESLVSLLGPNDRISVIGFSLQPRLLADQLAGDKAATLPDLIDRTPAEGGTNLELALRLANQVALRQKVTGAQNRVVLLTDGAANLGNADPAQLSNQIEQLRQQGIAFDACGVGLEGIDDEMLEGLTRKGDGRYYVLSSAEAAGEGFAKQLAGAFRPAALNVKVQVRFNPARVGHYRLIGFEKHRLNEEDFRNDQVDAAELAAEEAAVALYQVEARPDGQGELGEVFVRFRDAATGNMVERSWTLPYDEQARAFDRASPTLQLAGLAALLAEKMRGGAIADGIRLDELTGVVNDLRGKYPHDVRIQQLLAMHQQLRALGVQ